tara:strand:- start:993 stop:1304 length:312 start_codon:yes stop_codon:yes gene_type:complete
LLRFRPKDTSKSISRLSPRSDLLFSPFGVGGLGEFTVLVMTVSTFEGVEEWRAVTTDGVRSRDTGEITKDGTRTSFGVDIKCFDGRKGVGEDVPRRTSSGDSN